jgi:hypothetical protein
MHTMPAQPTYWAAGGRATYINLASKLGCTKQLWRINPRRGPLAGFFLLNKQMNKYARPLLLFLTCS